MSDGTETKCAGGHNFTWAAFGPGVCRVCGAMSSKEETALYRVEVLRDHVERDLGKNWDTPRTRG